MDYLHQTQSPFSPVIPDYTIHAADAYPYLIIVTNPTPTPQSKSGLAQVYGFQVDEPMVGLPIPLVGDERIAVNLSDVYTLTFSTDRRPYLMLDYEQPPLAFERYSPVDQTRIRAVMARVAQSV